ncbi:NADH-quinone oxidoreductase subunit J family protein [Lutimonas vermicola]|uniref:NADH-quinone oxidoreductase subunit J n=1 Tax=Lutimonas vermicola TaxID=414288 RepID=A0ABU9KZT1_9FLAO
METILFYILSALILIFAIASVSSRKILRAVIYLLFVLVAISGIYFMIDYSLLAAIQLAVYGGGVIVLIIFSVLLVHHVELELEVTALRKKIMAGIISAVGLGITLWAIYTFPFQTAGTDKTIEVADIGRKLLGYGEGGFILPFEVMSVLLLAVMVGAIVIAKGKKLNE